MPVEDQISFNQWGVPGGTPVVFFHGWPSSRVERFFTDAELGHHSLRWFSLDRPGYGETKFYPHHEIADWPPRVLRWAQEHGLERFHAVGFSAGGPYAAACAALLGDVVQSLTLIGSLCPFGDGETGVRYRPPWGKLGRLVLRRAPLIGVFALRALRRWSQSDPIGYERRMLRELHPADRAILQSPSLLELLAQAHAVAMQQGVRHIVRDLQLHDRPWTFDPRQIQCRTRIFVGAEDYQVPAQCSYWLRDKIKGASLVAYPREAHYIAYTHASEILRSIGN